jgi:hypothetical protein
MLPKNDGPADRTIRLGPGNSSLVVAAVASSPW